MYVSVLVLFLVKTILDRKNANYHYLYFSVVKISDRRI